MSEIQLQILEITKEFKGVSKKSGKAFTKKTLSVMLNGQSTEVQAFTKPWLGFSLNVGEIYNGTITETQYGLQFEATERIIDSDEPPEPPTPPKEKPPKSETPKAEWKAPPPKAGDTGVYTEEGTREVIYTHEEKKSKFIKEANILNNAVSIVSALISISQPVSGGDSDNKIQLGDSHHNVSELLQAYIKKFRKYYEED